MEAMTLIWPELYPDDKYQRIIVPADGQQHPLVRIRKARTDYVRDTGREPRRVLIGKDLYMDLCWLWDVRNLVRVYGVDVIVLPIPDACVCTGDNDDTTYKQ